MVAAENCHLQIPLNLLGQQRQTFPVRMQPSLYTSLSVVPREQSFQKRIPTLLRTYSHHLSQLLCPLLEHRGETHKLRHKKIDYTVKFLEDFVNRYRQEPVGVDFKDVRAKGRNPKTGLDRIH